MVEGICASRQTFVGGNLKFDHDISTLAPGTVLMIFFLGTPATTALSTSAISFSNTRIVSGFAPIKPKAISYLFDDPPSVKDSQQISRVKHLSNLWCLSVSTTLSSRQEVTNTVVFVLLYCLLKVARAVFNLVSKRNSVKYSVLRETISSHCRSVRDGISFFRLSLLSLALES